MPNRQETLYKDFSGRLAPRMVWHSESQGTYVKPRKTPRQGYETRLTEAQNNALGRAHRRRSNRKLRGWLPFAQR